MTMSYTNHLLHAVFALSLLASATSLKPDALVVPIRRSGTLLLAEFQSRTPLTTITTVVDLTASSLWLNCETNYTSTTLTQPTCGSPICNSSRSSYCHTCGAAARPFCHVNACGFYLENPATHQNTVGELAQDVLAAHSTTGPSPGPIVKIPDFLFTCSPSALVDSGLEGGQGVLGLAHAPIAAQNLIASKLKIEPVFTMCIPSGNAVGPLFFGLSPFSFLPGIDATKLLGFTPMIISPFNEYYVQVNSIKINAKLVQINSSMLTLDESTGVGGTTFSTTIPYTILESSVYKSVTSLYRKQLSGLKPVKPVGKFGLCYDAKGFSSTRLGPGSPSIDIELAGGVTWSISGANALVEAQPGVLCLAVVNGENLYRATVMIGMYQMKDNLVQVDLGRARVGFSGSLLGVRTNCGNFNFTSAAKVAAP